MVVGLGNPGAEYETTRHNAGFLAVDSLAGRLGRFSGWKRRGGMLRGEGRAGRHKVEVVKPQEYMNRSGLAIRGLMDEGHAASEILIVCDDVYLPLGTLRLRSQGGTGGHQGLESILMETASVEFPRLRIGVGPAPGAADLAEYVLAPFTDEERARLPQIIGAAADCALDAAANGLTQAMNRWNRFGRESTEE